MLCVSDQGNEVNEKECSTGASPQGSEECNMGPCVTNWYFTDWSNTVSNSQRQEKRNITALNSNPLHDIALCPSVFGAVWPRGAEEGVGVSDSRRGERGRWRRGLYWGQTSRDEGLQRGSLFGDNHVVQQPLDTGRTLGMKNE